jgi:phosphate transport system substrate-binding protein
MDLARQKGVEIKAVPIARDALVFIVNWKNPVAGLSIEQVRNVYTGKITNWADLGGERETIKPYRRNRNSGSEEKMQKLVMKGLPMTSAPSLSDVLVTSMFGPFNALRVDRQGIGYTPYYYQTYMANTPQVKVVVYQQCHAL